MNEKIRQPFFRRRSFALGTIHTAFLFEISLSTYYFHNFCFFYSRVNFNSMKDRKNGENKIDNRVLTTFRYEKNEISGNKVYP